MFSKSPEDVLRSVSLDLKVRGLTHKMAADLLGFGSKQTLSNLLASKKYMSPLQARKFVTTFGYDPSFLTSGVGELFPARETQDASPSDGQAVKRREGYPELVRLGDLLEKEMLLDWFHDYFEVTDDDKGMMFWAQVYRYFQGDSLVRQQMRSYKGDSYDKEYLDRIRRFKDSVAGKIDGMLHEMHQEKVVQ